MFKTLYYQVYEKCRRALIEQCQAQDIYTGLVSEMCSEQVESINILYTKHTDMMETESGGQHQSQVLANTQVHDHQGARVRYQRVQDGGDRGGCYPLTK